MTCFIKIKRAEAKQEVPWRRRRRVTPRRTTRRTNQHAARPTHTSTYAPLQDVYENETSRRRAGGSLALEAPCHTTTNNAPDEPARCTTNTHFDLCPHFKMFMKIKRAESEQEVPSRRRRRVTPRRTTRRRNQHAARPTHTSTYAPPFKMFMKIKRAEGEQEVPSRRRRRVTPRGTTRHTNQHVARPTHTSTYAPLSRCL